MIAETRCRVKAGLPGRERLSALHENRAPVRDGGALVLGGSAAGEVDALDRVASSGQDPQSAIATCLISCAPRPRRRREVACGVEVLIDRLARDLASAHLTPGMTRRSGIRFPQVGRTTTLALRLLRNVSRSGWASACAGGSGGEWRRLV
jgi:hypothetical protein